MGGFFVVIILRFEQKYHNKESFPINSNSKLILRITVVNSSDGLSLDFVQGEHSGVEEVIT